MRRILRAWLAAMSLAVTASPAVAQQPPATSAATQQPPQVIDMETVVVSGVQPGPGLWKVSKGDHVMWILGTLTPLPKRMEWQSAEAERVIAASQEVLSAPYPKVETGIGMFRAMFMLPTLLKAPKIPDDKTLRDVVPAPQYARWQALKARYIGSDRGVERMRPVFAAMELYEKAIEKSGMVQTGVVWPVVKKAAKKHRIKITEPVLTIRIKDAKNAAKEFAKGVVNDSDCFDKTLDRIEGDIGNMAARANAWAVGDVAALRDLPAQNQFTACTAALTETEVARKQGMHDLPAQLRAVWLKTAETSLGNNASTFAVLPISLMLAPNGYLDALRAKGYTVQAPDEVVE